MEEKLNTWKQQEFIQRYFEQLTLQIQNGFDNDLISIVELENKYAIILKTEKILTPDDIIMLRKYIQTQLISSGYVITSEKDNFISLQATVERRVSGVQLYGNIKLVTFPAELQIIVSPYNDRQFEKPIPREELISELFH